MTMPKTHAEQTRERRVQSAHKARQTMLDRYAEEQVREFANAVDASVRRYPGEVCYKDDLLADVAELMANRGLVPRP